MLSDSSSCHECVREARLSRDVIQKPAGSCPATSKRSLHSSEMVARVTADGVPETTHSMIVPAVNVGDQPDSTAS
jgi:hypothetical protein